MKQTTHSFTTKSLIATPRNIILQPSSSSSSSSSHRPKIHHVDRSSYGRLPQRLSLSTKTTPNNNDDDDDNNSKKKGLLSILTSPQSRRSFVLSTLLAGVTNLVLSYAAPPGFKRIPTQFIAALGNPRSSSGSNADEWGLWPLDPGPRGVFLRDYQNDILLSQNDDNRAPAGWTFDANDWWLEEHGLIMEAPSFPLPTGRYLVTGGRLITTILTVGKEGEWTLENGRTLGDVTHLPCRSARYRPLLSAGDGNGGSPLTAKESDFPVRPGAEMPMVEGCEKVDYAVLFVIGTEI